MKSPDAKEIQQKFSIPHHYEAALQFFSAAELQSMLSVLDALQVLLGDEIADYSLENTHDLLDTDTPIIVRTYWFSKGMREYYVCIDACGFVRTLDAEIPTRLSKQISKVLDALCS